MRGRPEKEFNSGANLYAAKAASPDLNQQAFAPRATRSMVDSALRSGPFAGVFDWQDATSAAVAAIARTRVVERRGRINLLQWTG
jgi:hypothetical protein